MANLKVNTDDVRSVSYNLNSITKNLESAAADSNDLSGMIPVDDLSRAVRDFANKWDDTRRGLVEDITTLKDKATAIADAFEEVDNSLVDALTASPVPPKGAH